MQKTISLSDFLRSFEGLMDVPSESMIPECEFRALEKWDSLTLVELLAMLDKDYGVTVDVGQLDRCKTVSDIFNLVNE